MQDKNNLIWLDMEMTGLDVSVNRIIEAAFVITNNDLEIVAQGPVIAIHQSDELLGQMDEWNTKTHTGSGLVDRVRASTYDERKAELELLEFVKTYVPKGVSPMCGNSIHQDRRFMKKYMPELEEWFHYRNLDVSTVKELAKRWNPRIYGGYKKKAPHKALDDILSSVEELRYYRDNFLVMPDSSEGTPEA